MSYSTTHEHLFAELDRIKQITEGHEIEPQSTVAEPDTVDEKIDPTALSLALPADKRKTIHEQRETIRQHAHNSDQRLRLRVLSAVCELSRRHLDVLLLAIAPHLNVDCEEQFRRAHNDYTLNRPTVRYIETLFGRTPAERLAARRLVDRSSPLREYGLIELQRPDGTVSDQTQLIVPSERVVEYLSGDDSLDPELTEQLEIHTQHGAGVDECEADSSLDDLMVSDKIRGQLAPLTESTDPLRCYWYGPASEKQRAVDAIVDGQYLCADLQAVLRANALEWLCREAALLGRALHLSNATAAVDDPETNSSLSAVFEACETLPTDLIITGSDSWMPTETLSTELDAIIAFPYPTVDLRRAFWESHAPELPEDLDPAVVAGTFRLTHEQLQAALSTARTLADGPLTSEDVYAGCSAQSTSQLGELAELIEPDSSWDEIQLRAETERKLRLVETHITQQSTIYTDWGFEDRFSHGTGVVALFEGPSGTGKTMAAEILAGEVGMDLYRIDLSSVVSKYIGETEQKLEAIFEAATNANAILLFDEADAVFGDRTAVSDSTDRYANAQVNYLLQRIERYDGVVLLTTNYASQIDSAFQRRLDHTVSFKKPQQDTRSAIWQEMFPETAPLGEIDYAFLSEFKFTGGEIKTIAQTAAILAADDPEEPQIGMQHLVEAIQQAVEQKGLLVDPTNFEPYDHYLYRDKDEPTTAVDTTSGVETSLESERSKQKMETNGATATPERDLDEATDQTTQTDVDSNAMTPESVVRTFFDRLDRGALSIRELYHSNAIVEQVSPKQLRRAQHTDNPVLEDLQRVQDEPSRVRISCIRKQQSQITPLAVELRLDGNQWRVFDLTETAQVSS